MKIYLVFTADKSLEPYDVDYEGEIFRGAYDSEEKANDAAEELETEQIEVNIIEEFLK
jgi:hypothetical protein